MVGAACALPGAQSLDDFWSLLTQSRHSISRAPQGRWSVERFLRPGPPEPGFAYTFAGGYLDDPFLFDPAPFGISPREAQQMDPQQRLLLELVWRAFEDAGIAPSSVQGGDVGVYVGASNVDYLTGAIHDAAAVESHFMTGNSLSILSNRLSYVFDLRGPSITIDTACSSSFAALAEAMSALQAGTIDMAVVAGVNLLLSPIPFIGFSQARMLSPTGRCKPFSQAADGYVRSEGGVALILRRREDALLLGDRSRAVIMGAAVNADGRTSGISLPSSEGQQAVIDSLYSKLRIDPEQLAFIEAHGTGTPVGDPIEAAAIGEALGQRRSSPLLIGSAKSNVGHLESASGLVGLVKSMLALEHRVLPPTLVDDELNASIDFERLNLSVTRQLTPLDADGPLVAGVCNYGFGGVNVHVALRAAEGTETTGDRPSAARMLLVTAATREALVARAGQFADEISQGRPAGEIAGALGHQQDAMTFRLAVPIAGESPDRSVVARLEDFAKAGERKDVATGAASASFAKSVFVYSGNGAQFAGMGREAFLASADFRNEIEAIDALFMPLAGWSLAAVLKDGVVSDQLVNTSVAQPIIYAVQSALTAVLARWGIRPMAVVGHSVGEIAAAEACGALSRREAVRVIYERSSIQETVRGQGRMLAVGTGGETTAAEIAAAGFDRVEIAAFNGPGSTTVAGPAEDLRRFATYCRRRRIATIPLDIDYPFHTSALDPLRPEIAARLSGLAPRSTDVKFVSTVTGGVVDGTKLGAGYWWRNLREPVRFADAIASALDLGGSLFVEIGLRPILVSAVSDSIRARASNANALGALTATIAPGHDVCLEAVARLIASGCDFDSNTAFGRKPNGRRPLPPYPFQRTRYVLPHTSEALRADGVLFETALRQPLLGSRLADGSPEWRCLLDPTILPYLADHCVDGTVVVPASGLAEIALAVGAAVFGRVPLELDDFDIGRALAFAPGEMRELSTIFVESIGTVEVRSRRRFSGDDWTSHARGLVRPGPVLRSVRPELPGLFPLFVDGAQEIYAEARRAGLEYGPLFQVVEQVERDHFIGVARLSDPVGGMGAFTDCHVLHPIILDAAFHALFIARPQKDGETIAHLPVRFRKLRVWDHGARPHRAITRLINETGRYKTVTIALLDADGGVVASLEAAVLRAVVLSRSTTRDRTFTRDNASLTSFDSNKVLEAVRASGAGAPVVAPRAWLLLRAFALSLAHRLVCEVMAASKVTEIAVARERTIAPAGRAYFDVLVAALKERGALVSSGSGVAFAPDVGGASPEVLLATLVRAFPEAAADIQLAAGALERASLVLQEGALLPPPAIVLAFETAGRPANMAVERLASVLSTAADAAGRRLRVLALEPFNGALWRALWPLSSAGRIDVTCAGMRPSVIESGRRAAPEDYAWINLSVSDGGNPAPFDALVCLAEAEREHALLGERFEKAFPQLIPGAPVIIAAPGQDFAIDVLRGVWSGWLNDGSADSTDGRVHGLDHFVRALRRHASDIDSQPIGDGVGHLITAFAKGVKPVEQPLIVSFAVVDDRAAAHPSAVMRFGCEPDRLVCSTELEAALHQVSADEPGAQAFVLLPPLGGGDCAVDGLVRRIDIIRNALNVAESAGAPPKIVIVTVGASSDGDPVEAGVYGFARTAINEYPGVDLRIVDIAPDAAPAVAPDAIALLIQSAHGEREFVIDAHGASVARIRRDAFPERALGDDDCSVLQFAYPGLVKSFEWSARARQAPGPGEIEIEVAFVGLNFRDVLVGLGVLDDDLLAAGLTGASLGFECSGVVVRSGVGAPLQPGAHVMGFAAGAFASHVTAPAGQFFAVPQNVSLEAAATIPVAFATAWHSLMERAHVRAGEDVLIHGGAGGLGLAAIQIAKLAGARVIATAGSASRRAIARAAGADLVFDSRGKRFVAPIMESVGGVDVALNSIAGAAMVETFRLVKPFGRFIEVGKRDYLDNTHLALRPFVRNITYAGVDLDELLAHDKAAAARIMNALADQFDRGELRPLPYQVYEPHEIADAFRAMQASEHIGKIVVRPSRRGRPELSDSFRPRAGAWLVVGGTSGLGFATAQWLARKGVTTLILASRRGAVDDASAQSLEDLRSAGAHVRIEALDVTDAAMVQNLVHRIEAECGPLRGVVHAAVHLDDGLISGLDSERLRGVLRAKVEGALNLDRAVAACDLDAFVLYSSATTLIGSPGQSAYVAANAYLEGLARQRRAQNRPALAIGWGAISDVGILARDPNLAQRLKRATGVGAIPSSDALAFLGRLLDLGLKADPVHHYTKVSAAPVSGRLALLASPAFKALDGGRAEAVPDGGEGLAAAIAGKSMPDALATILHALRHEVAQILRMPASEVDPHRPLAQMGFDSLMALELQLAVERLGGIQLPMMGASDRSLSDLASGVLSQMQVAPDDASVEAPEAAVTSEIEGLTRRHSAAGRGRDESDRRVGQVQDALKG
ncbi:MAG: type I polyketide synthase [Beijerinckiaceae bacterium]|nr:type I polyketide synthase [Beijerinckiaceae bacterium]